jgi:hypothetical protein
MTRKYGLSLFVITLITLALAAATFGQLQPQSKQPRLFTSDLNFKLDTVSVVIDTGGNLSGVAFANVDLYIWWDSGTLRTGTINEIEVHVCYDHTKLQFVDSAFATDTAAWHGSYDLNLIDGICAGGNTMLVVWLDSDPDNPDVAYDEPTRYATLRFRLLCQDTTNLPTLTLNEAQSEMRLPDTTFISESLIHGAVNIDGIGEFCCCQGIRGNFNTDPYDATNVADLTGLVQHLFGSPPGPPSACPEEGNIDGQGVVNVEDLTRLVNYLFVTEEGVSPAPCPLDAH